MQTRRKSSELIEPDLQKKVKTGKESNLRTYIKNKQTRLVLKAKGIQNLFPIQQQCFEPIYEGHDMIGQDRTGSGKTMAYCLPLLEKIRDQQLPQNKTPYILVLIPTRELAIQVTTECKSILHSEGEYRVLTVYGGTDLRTQIDQVRQGCDICIGTPGRILDLLQRGCLKLSAIQTLVLDEADQMLNFGFQEDIEKVFEHLNKQIQHKAQLLLFSATIPSWVMELSRKYMDPNRKLINLIKKHESQASTTVKHYAIPCARNEMVGTIGDVVSVYGGRHCRTIIFCETKRDCNDIILKAKLPSETQPLHGDIPQQQRTITFEGFKSGKFKCLVATNVASRGLDFPQVDLIVQCNPSKDIDTYIHRSGRTGRAGKEGVCVTFFAKREATLIDRIQKLAKIKFLKISAPQHVDIIKASTRDLALSLKSVSAEIVKMFEPVAQEIIESLDAKEALARALACVSGYKDKFSTRSMLGSFEGYITYILRSTTKFNAVGYIWKFLKANFSEVVCNNIKGMKKLKLESGVAFDVADDVKEEFDARIQEMIDNDEMSNFTIEQATELPEIQEENQYTQNSGPQSFVPANIKKEQEVFIGGLDFNVTEQEINHVFKQKGVEFIALRCLSGEDGQFKGIAFGCCRTKEMVQQALELNGYKMKGRALRVNMANQKPK